VAGGLECFDELVDAEPIAVVGARSATAYGVEVARSLGRGLAAAGLPVVSGMAAGIDAAAHAGALEAPGPTVAVLPGGADRPYPRAKRALYQRICAGGTAISELPPSVPVRRWMFPARNRIIAGLSAMTVVVEASAHSGALLTAAHADELTRPVGAVPGPITSPLTAGTHRLIADGATLIRSAQDVLDALFGAGARAAPAVTRPRLDPELERLLTAVRRGHDTVAGLVRAGFSAADGLAALSALELGGYVRRVAGGRYVALP
jgi:DNA processing protein